MFCSARCSWPRPLSDDVTTIVKDQVRKLAKSEIRMIIPESQGQTVFVLPCLLFISLPALCGHGGGNSLSRKSENSFPETKGKLFLFCPARCSWPRPLSDDVTTIVKDQVRNLAKSEIRMIIPESQGQTVFVLQCPLFMSLPALCGGGKSLSRKSEN